MGLRPLIFFLPSWLKWATSSLWPWDFFEWMGWRLMGQSSLGTKITQWPSGSGDSKLSSLQKHCMVRIRCLFLVGSGKRPIFSGELAVSFRKGSDFHWPADRIPSEWAMAMLHKWTVLQPVSIPFSIKAKPSNRKTACNPVAICSTVTIYLNFPQLSRFKQKPLFSCFFSEMQQTNSTNLPIFPKKCPKLGFFCFKLWSC